MGFDSRTFRLDAKGAKKYVRFFGCAEDFVEDFRRRFDYILAYHATVVDEFELDSIRTDGLVVASTELLKSKAKSRFQGADIQMNQAIGADIEQYFENEKPITLGNAYFSLNEKVLLTRSYQYLYFGPEVLLPLADKLTEKFGIYFRQSMMKFGSPCIIKAQVPVELTEKTWLVNIYEYHMNCSPEASLVYNRDLPSSQILEIKIVERPENIYRIPLD